MDGEGPSPKRSKLSEENVPNESVAVVVAADVNVNAAPNAPVPRQTVDILKLNFDCFEKVFDNLRIDDLISIGKTCKRLQKVAGHCFRQTYPNITINMESDGIKVLVNDIWLDATHFARFIHKMHFTEQEGYITREFLKIQSTFHRLREVTFDWVNFSNSEEFKFLKINLMRRTFCKLKVMRLINCFMTNEEFVQILDHCVKLKHLELRWEGTFPDIDFDWSSRTYPTLEYFGFIPIFYGIEKICKKDMTTIITMLELNPNIRRFATSDEFVWQIRNLIKDPSVIKLDELIINLELDYYECEMFYRVLNALHRRGFYQQLHLRSLKELTPNVLDQLATLTGLVKLSSNDQDMVALPLLKNLEEIRLYETSIMNTESSAKNLVNLKRMQVADAHFDDLISFIRHSVELNKIKVKVSPFQNGIYFSNRTHVIDLVALNRERRQLPNARKITLYDDEKVYLATKKSLKETNLDLIRLKRWGSFKRGDEF